MDQVRKVTVYLAEKERQKVGTLASRDRKIYFEYDKSWLQRGIEISPYKLPLKSGLFACEDDLFEGLWGVFNDSLPDGWGRLLMDRHMMKLGMNARVPTPLDRLTYVGDHAMGALSYEPEVEMEHTMEPIVLDDLAGSSQAILEGSSDILLEELLSLNGSSAGARPKVLVQISDDRKKIVHGRQKLKEGYAHWMVKFASSSDSIESGAIEYAYSLMAKDAGLDMSETALLEGKKGRYFACERFDRRGESRVHMHSAAGMLHSDFRYPSLDYDDLMSLALHLTKSVVEQEKVFRLACFNLFVHNRDDHAKNFSFLMDEKGLWTLSPVYDMTFSQGPGGEHSTMYLGEGKNPTVAHLLRLGEKHGLKSRERVIEEVKLSVRKWKEFATVAGLPNTTIQSLGKIFFKIARQ